MAVKTQTHKGWAECIIAHTHAVYQLWPTRTLPVDRLINERGNWSLEGQVHPKMKISYFVVFGTPSRMVKVRGACDKPFWICPSRSLCFCGRIVFRDFCCCSWYPQIFGKCPRFMVFCNNRGCYIRTRHPNPATFRVWGAFFRKYFRNIPTMSTNFRDFARNFHHFHLQFLYDISIISTQIPGGTGK